MEPLHSDDSRSRRGAISSAAQFNFVVVQGLGFLAAGHGDLVSIRITSIGHLMTPAIPINRNPYVPLFNLRMLYDP